MVAQAIVHFVRHGGVSSVGRLKAQMAYLSRRHFVDGVLVPIVSRDQVELQRSQRYFQLPIDADADSFETFAREFLESTGRLRPGGTQELTSHIVASFPEHVDRHVAQSIATEFVWELFNHPDGEEDKRDENYDDGYDYFSAFHNDTDNPHIHLIVNRDPFARVHELRGADGQLSGHHLDEWLRISRRNPVINWDSMRERLAQVARRHGVDLIATPHEERGGIVDQPLTQAEYWRRHREQINFEVVDGGIDYEPPHDRAAASGGEQGQIVRRPDGSFGIAQPPASGHGGSSGGDSLSGGAMHPGTTIPSSSGRAGTSRAAAASGAEAEAAEAARIQRLRNELFNVGGTGGGSASSGGAPGQHGGGSGGSFGTDGGVDGAAQGRGGRSAAAGRDGEGRSGDAPSPESTPLFGLDDDNMDSMDNIYDATPRGSPAPNQGAPTRPQSASGSGGGSIGDGESEGGEPQERDRHRQRRSETRASEERRVLDEEPARRRRPAAPSPEDGRGNPEPQQPDRSAQVQPDAAGASGGQAGRQGADNANQGRGDAPEAGLGQDHARRRRRRTEVELLTEGQQPPVQDDLTRGVETRGQKRKRAEMEEATRIGGEPSTHEMELRGTRARQEREQRIQREAREAVRQREKAPRRPGRGPNNGNDRGES